MAGTGTPAGKGEALVIHVIATIEVAPGKRKEYLKILKQVAPQVRAEKGCIAYVPTVDHASGLPTQCELREDIVTLVEAWEGLDDLMDHLKTAHMLSYRKQVKDLVKGLSIQVLKPV
jgi:quinol monooxygenase YgiN